MLNRCLSLGLVIGLTSTVGVHYVVPLPSYAAELQEIQARGHLIVGVKDNLRPLGFRNAEGELVGLEIDLARRLAEDLLGSSEAVVLQPVSNPERISAVAMGEVDLAIARITATPSRARIVNFSRPYYSDGTGLVTRAPGVQQLMDLSRRSIAVLRGSSTISTVRSLLPNANLVGVESYQDAYTKLENGQADAFAADASVLSGWVQADPSYRLLPTLMSAEVLAVAVPKGLQHDELRRRVDEAIARWQADGWLQERIDYWGLPQ